MHAGFGNVRDRQEERRRCSAESTAGAPFFEPGPGPQASLSVYFADGFAGLADLASSQAALRSARAARSFSPASSL